MRLEELDYELPEEAIAQEPSTPRDSCRLMYLPGSGPAVHAVFSELPGLLRPGDVLVFNDSKVLQARVLARKRSGAVVEVLFLARVTVDEGGGEETWEALVRPSKRLRAGTPLAVGEGQELVVGEYLGEGRWLVRSTAGLSVSEAMERYGRLPLPPYIKHYPDDADAYQTVYARTPGSAAAPTAGLHFTEEMLEALDRGGVRKAEVTLHVGLDTFLPIREARVEDHAIHTERYEVSRETLRSLGDVKEAGGRVIAVGTTAARVLETLARNGELNGGSAKVVSGGSSVRGSTDIFITPGHEFLAVDGLLTNFHLPCSSVLALTMAFAGVERIRHSYQEALRRGYRFFSFGDAMLVMGEGREGGHA